MRVVVLAFVAVLVTAPLSEGGKKKRWWNKGKSESSSEDEYGDKSFEFQTYNAALNIPTLGGLTRATRMERLLNAIRSSTADVLLLQEVGSEVIILQIIDAVREYFPHSLSFLGVDATPGSGEPVDACADLPEYLTCIKNKNCAGDNRTTEDRFYCPWRHCNMIVEDKPPISIECVECAIKPCYSMARVQNISALQECFDEVIADGYCNVAHTDRPPRDTSSGTTSLHGLLLLSKREIRRFWLHDIIYPSGVQTLSDKGFLIAKIRGIGYVVGTQLSLDCPEFTDYSSGMTMWNTVNNWEMYHVFEKVCEDLGDKRKVVVLGGTNNGPAVTNVCPEVREKFPRNFRIAGNNGFRSVLLGSVNRQCTRCETNPLTMADDVNINTISDHIFVKEDSYLETVETKVLVNTLNSQSGPGSEPFSPYYGVSARITGFGKKQKSSELFSWSVDHGDLFPSSWKWTDK